MGHVSPGQALIVTGSTGSGKSTTCKAFVEAMEPLWLHFGVDLFLGQVVPRKFVDGGPRCAEGVHMVPDDPAAPDGPRHMALGRYGAQMIGAFHRMAAEAVRCGQNVVLDHVTTLDPPILQDCVAAFRGLPVTFVALKPPAEIIPQRIDARLDQVAAVLGREQARHNNANTKRISRYMAGQIFAHADFDLVVDTHAHAPEAVARQIAEALQQPGRAFPELARKLDAGEPPFAAAAPSTASRSPSP
jgi:chloramphenicol 3-O-phosphotransferase